MDQPKKRQISPALRKILNNDIFLTKEFNKWAQRTFPVHKWKTYFKALEISCHGIPWFVFWICFTWVFNNRSLIQLQVNMLLGLFLDIIFVACLKAYTRRKRPVSNKDDMLGQIGPDVFSFPSGHCSRAMYVAYFFIYLYPLFFLWRVVLILWSIAICISRILMDRHHILDVLAGVALGFLNGMLVGFLFIGENTAVWLMSIISDEKLEGGDYHV